MNNNKIISLKNNYIKNLYKLKYYKYRTFYKKILVEGWNLFFESINNSLIVKVLILEKFLDKIINLNINIDKKNIIIVNKEIINKLSNNVSNPGIITVLDLNKFYLKSKINFKENFLLLENIQNPSNLGTLLRLSFGFNIKNILLLGECVDIFNYKVLNSSQGAIFNLNILNIKKNYFNFINKLKINGYKIITTGLKEKKTFFLDNFNFNFKKIVFCFGNEGKGLTKEMLKLSDFNIKININSKLNSLNIVQAASIILYEFNKKKGNNFFEEYVKNK